MDENHRKRIHKGGKIEFYQPILDQYEELLKQHPVLESVTFCWMQGERDANGGADAAYKKSLQQLYYRRVVNQMRKILEVMPKKKWLTSRCLVKLSFWTKFQKEPLAKCKG